METGTSVLLDEQRDTSFLLGGGGPLRSVDCCYCYFLVFRFAAEAFFTVIAPAVNWFMRSSIRSSFSASSSTVVCLAVRGNPGEWLPLYTVLNPADLFAAFELDMDLLGVLAEATLSPSLGSVALSSFCSRLFSFLRRSSSPPCTPPC